MRSLARDPSPTVRELALLYRLRPSVSVPEEAVEPPEIQSARNSGDPEVLGRLAKNVRFSVRAAVAGNPATPEEVLVGLGQVPDVDIQVALVRNPSTPQTTYDALLTSSFPRTLESLIENPRTRCDQVRSLVQPDVPVRVSLAAGLELLDY